MSDVYSADTDDLDDFVDRGAAARSVLTSTLGTLVRQRDHLLGAGFPTVVEHSELGAVENTLVFAADLDRFVADISASLKRFGVDRGAGVYEAPVGLTRARLDSTDDLRLDDLELALAEAGVNAEDALVIRQRVEAELAGDPRFEIGGATVSEPKDLADAILGLAEARATQLIDRHTNPGAGRGRQDRLNVGRIAEERYFGGPIDGLIPPSLLDRALADALDQEDHADYREALARLAGYESAANWSLAVRADGPIELDGDLAGLNRQAADLYDASLSFSGRDETGRLNEAELAYQLQALAADDPAKALSLKWLLEPMLSSGQRADLDRILATNGDFGEGIGVALDHPVDGAIGAGKGFWNSNVGWLADGWADAMTAITYGFYGMAANSAPGVDPMVRQALPAVPDTWAEIDGIVELELDMDNVAQRGGADLAFLAEVTSAAYGGAKGGLTLVRAGRRYFLRSGADVIAEVGPDLARQLDGVPARPRSSVHRVQGGTMPRASRERILIGPAGELQVTGDKRLYVTFDDVGRAKAYVANNRPGASIITFDVDPEFVDEVRAAAIEQADAELFPGAPQIADETKTTGSFGLPGEWITRLEEAAIPGTGRTIEP